MLAPSREIEIGGGRCRVPSLDHLIALKLHVLKQRLSHRGYKDFMDVLSLVQANQLDVRSDTSRLCARAMAAKESMSESSPSNPELRETAAAFRADVGAADLEFPIVPDFNSHPPQLSPAAYVAWCEEMHSLLPSHANRAAAARCLVEFVL
jgi:hypothetical protein